MWTQLTEVVALGFNMGTHIAFAVFCQSKAILKVYFCKNLVEGLEVAYVEGPGTHTLLVLGISAPVSSELATGLPKFAQIRSPAWLVFALGSGCCSSLACL